VGGFKDVGFQSLHRSKKVACPELRLKWVIRCIYTGVLHRHTGSQNRTLLVLLLSLVTMGSPAMSTRQSHPPPVRKRVHKSVSTISKPGYAPDTRRLALLTYFRACSCPAAKWASTFIREADRNELDWRLVASIAMVESTGGKHYKNRNILGWGSAVQRFPSEQVGIQYVSSRLHSSPLYTRKSLNQMLLTYNSDIIQSGAITLLWSPK
jgi:hypothetical protein